MRYFKFCDVPAGAPNPVPNEGNDIDNDNYHTSINQMYLGIFQYGASLKNVCAAWACGNINIYFGYQWQKTVSFDVALKNAIRKVWPGAIDYGDVFHVLQACQMWLEKHGAHALRDEMTPMLQGLIRAPSLVEFNSLLAQFQAHWRY